MSVEKSAGAIIFRKQAGKTYYLLLHYPKGSRTLEDYWDLPKGHIEKGENETEAARREVEEETGLEDIELIDGFGETIKYFFKANEELIFKTVVFYLAETKTQEIRISLEHKGFEWLSYQEAMERFTFKNAKEVLKKANAFLKQQKLI